MSNRKIVAFIGVSEIKIIFLAKQIAKTSTVLLFDQNNEVLTTVYSQILAENPKANVEMMICPTNACWEADSIVFSNAAAADGLLVEQIRKVATGKIVIIWANHSNNCTVENPIADFQPLFPFSKVIQSIAATADLKDVLFLKGNDAETLQMVATLFTSIGLINSTQLSNTTNF